MGMIHFKRLFCDISYDNMFRVSHYLYLHISKKLIYKIVLDVAAYARIQLCRLFLLGIKVKK